VSFPDPIVILHTNESMTVFMTLPPSYRQHAGLFPGSASTLLSALRACAADPACAAAVDRVEGRSVPGQSKAANPGGGGGGMAGHPALLCPPGAPDFP
jgi:hypothetical protein